MAYFGLSFWSIEEKKSLGAMIVDGDGIENAVEKMIACKVMPAEIEDGTAMAVASEIEADQLRYYPLEMFNTLISMDKLKEFVQKFKTEEEEESTAH